MVAKLDLDRKALLDRRMFSLVYSSQLGSQMGLCVNGSRWNSVRLTSGSHRRKSKSASLQNLLVRKLAAAL